MDSAFVQYRAQVLDQFSALNAENQDLYDLYLLNLFQFQYKYNEIYQQYCTNLGISINEVKTSDQIPHLPISAFKHHVVKTGIFNAEEIFKSSGTTGSVRSAHHVSNIAHYRQNTIKIWEQAFGKVSQFCFLALLPGYLERDGSSLISMVDHFIRLSEYEESGFLLHEHQLLYEKLIICKQKKIPTVLFGVPYALLDFTDHYTFSYPGLMIMETGGMKGQRAEIPKEALHEILRQKLGAKKIYSEYGMTELMSQAYTKDGNIFKPDHHLKVTTRQINDPLSPEKYGKTGIICISDAANIDSCAFILTEDLGMVYPDGSFEIAGRLDSSDIRGCNLLIEEITA